MARKSTFPLDRSVSTDVVHARIHQGVMFTAQAFDPGVVDDGFLDVLILPAQNGDLVSMHFRAQVRVGADATLRAYRSQLPGQTSVPIARSADGDPVPTENRNQFSDLVAAGLIFKNPTLDVPATPAPEIDAAFEFFPGGTGGNSSGTQGAIWQEWILRTDTEYLVRVTNIGGNAQPVQIELDWYEPYQRVV